MNRKELQFSFWASLTAALSIAQGNVGLISLSAGSSAEAADGDAPGTAAEVSEEPAVERKTGVVKWFNARKGLGCHKL